MKQTRVGFSSPKLVCCSQLWDWQRWWRWWRLWWRLWEVQSSKVHLGWIINSLFYPLSIFTRVEVRGTARVSTFIREQSRRLVEQDQRRQDEEEEEEEGPWAWIWGKPLRTWWCSLRPRGQMVNVNSGWAARRAEEDEEEEELNLRTIKRSRRWETGRADEEQQKEKTAGGETSGGRKDGKFQLWLTERKKKWRVEQKKEGERRGAEERRGRGGGAAGGKYEEE